MSDPRAASEAALEPDLPIVDPHHHLWAHRSHSGDPTRAPEHGFEWVGRLTPRYLLDELLADLRSGHDIRATVHIQCHQTHRADGPEALKPVGETEFVNGVAALSASGLYGPLRVAAGIVGHANLTLGDAVAPVLEAHIRAGGDRFRGIRHSGSWDADRDVLGPVFRTGPGLYRSETFREGFAHLERFGLSFDAWLVEPQLGDLIDLARAFPETPIVLDHVGTPLGLGGYAGRREERFPIWREAIRALAQSPNVCVKLGGLAMVFTGFPSFMADPPATSEQLARDWRPYIETCIEAFGPDRCMFESNFPVDKCGASYVATWNAFKRIASGCSADEKTALFSGAACRFYRLSI
jgi:L-fuconolactonase